MNLVLNWQDLASIAPLMALFIAALGILLLTAISESLSNKISSIISALTFIAAIAFTLNHQASQNPMLTDWLRFDYSAQFFNLFFLVIGLCVIAFSTVFFQKYAFSQGEYYFLLLSAIFGLMLIGMSADFLTLFLGIETFSITLYVLCNYMKAWKYASESAIKYFLMGSLAAAFFLYGIALIYGALGTTNFNEIHHTYSSIVSTPHHALFLGGIAFVTLGLAFEAAIVPFQLWAPDVYSGSMTPITALMAVGTKVGAFAAFSVVFFIALPHFSVLWNETLTIFIYLTLIYANYVALRQTHFRRFFAYSGISHAGFLLIPLAVGTEEAFSALLFYLMIYAFATLGSFAVLMLIDQGEKDIPFSALKGLFYRSPMLATFFALCFLTLAGLPPTIGFFAKFYLFKVALDAGFYGVVIVGLLTSVLAAYYYIRIIKDIFVRENAAKWT